MVPAFSISRGERIFGVANGLVVGLLCLVTLYPFYYMIITSLSDPVLGRGSYLWIKELYTVNYWLVFTTGGLGRAYLVTILAVVCSVPLTLLVTGGAAFALTRRHMRFRVLIIIYYLITMFFSGGLIPLYLVLKNVGLINTFWVLVLPEAFSVFTLIVMKTSFQAIPDSLVDSALIDGADYRKIFFRIMLPLSTATLAALGLFRAVRVWNDWFAGAFFITDPRLKPLQTFLRLKVLEGGIMNIWWSIRRTDPETYKRLGLDPDLVEDLANITPLSLKSAYIIVTTLPILALYPFLQRYFVKGVLVGAIRE